MNNKTGKTSVKIGGKKPVQAQLVSKKVLKVAGRAKSACRGKTELFNQTAPIKFFTNLDDRGRESAGKEIGVNVGVTREGSSESKSKKSNTNKKQRESQSSVVARERHVDDQKVQGGTQKLSFSKRKPSLMQGTDAGSQSRKSQHKTNQQSVTSSLIEFNKSASLNQTTNVKIKPQVPGQITIEGSHRVSSQFVAKMNSSNGDYSIPQGQASGSMKPNKQTSLKAYATQMNATQTIQNQQNSKLKLHLNCQKTRSTSSLSSENRQHSIPNQNNTTEVPKSYQTVKAQLTTNGKLRTSGIPTEIKKQPSSTKPPVKDQAGSNIQAGALKKKQTLRGLMEAHNLIKGTTKQGSQNKRKSSLSPYSSSQQTKTQIGKPGNSVQNSNYGATQSFTKVKDPKPNPISNYNSFTGQTAVAPVTDVNGSTHAASGSKSSSSLKHLPANKKKLNNSLLLFNSTAKQTFCVQNFNGGPAFARVDLDRINSGANKKQVNNLKNNVSTTKNQQLTESYLSTNNNSQKQIFNRSSKVSTNIAHKALDSSITRLNLPKPNSRKSIEESTSYFGTCTASGPLNPFLEQILKEIPNAATVNSSNMNSVTCNSTVNMALWADGTNPIGQTLLQKKIEKDIPTQSQSKSQGKLSKKIRHNITGEPRKDKRQMSNKLNLTTTATALLAASDKNAAEMINTFDTQGTLSGQTSKHNVGYLQSDTTKIESLAKQRLEGTKTDMSTHSTKKKTGSKGISSATTLEAQEKRREQSTSYVTRQSDSRPHSRISHKRGGKQSSCSSKRYKVTVKKTDTEEREEINNSNVTNMSQKLGSLMNVVKVAAKQKESKMTSSLINQKMALVKKNHHSFNNTQVLEEQLQSLKLQNKNPFKNSFAIPQKLKTQTQQKTQKQAIQTMQQLQQASGQIGMVQPRMIKQAVEQQRLTPCNERTIEEPSPVQSQSKSQARKMKEAKRRIQQINESLLGGLQTLGGKNSSNQNNQKQHHSQSRIKNRKSNCVQMDWSGFLSNILHENLKPKKSTSGPGNVGSALYSKPYQDMQNKTQPLPKGLIKNEAAVNNAYAQETKLEPYGAVNSAAQNFQKMERRGSECRPRIGRKQIEIAPPSGAQTHFAATLNNQQLKGVVAAANQAVTVLTEATDSAAEESKNNKESSGSAPSTHRSPDKVNQDYKFGRLLGEGAYAVVRLAHKTSENKSYAAKIYDKSKLIDEHRRSSVCREVMLMQKLNHQYIVKFHEAFETDHHVYLIIEHVNGRSLHDYLKKQRSEEGKTEFDQSLEEEEAKRIMRQVLQCLEYLHTSGITHRDIKLENILLDEYNNIKIIDFGFSTCYTPQKKVKLFCGTPSYMAPEIVSRIEYYGPPADIWASGVLLFSLLNGFFPFKGQTDAELYRRIQRGMFKLIRSDLSDDCLNLLKEMLNVNCEARMTANELLQENWFMTDSSKKRSHAEIRRQFKARILKKFPIKSVSKNTICLPATQPNIPQVQQPIAQTDAPEEESKESKVVLQDSLTNNRNIQQASPPSCMSSNQPNHSTSNVVLSPQQQVQQMQLLQQSTSSQHQEGEQINQEALLAYYNTSGGQMHPTVTSSAPPSGKFTPYVAYQGNIPAQTINQHDVINTDSPAYEQAIPPLAQRWPPVQVKRDNFLQSGQLLARKEDPNEFVDETDIEIVIQGVQPNNQADAEAHLLDKK